MGWFDSSSTIGAWAPGASSKHHRSDKSHRSSSRHRSSGSVFGSGDRKHNSSKSTIFGGDHHHKHNASRSSLFGGNYDKHNSSRSSFFGGFGGGSRSSSHYKRSPRGGFIKRAYAKLRQLLRDLLYYMKRNPMKVFMLVILPLITGGALTALLRKFGIRLPHSIEKLMGGSPKGAGRGNSTYERTSVKTEGPLASMGGVSNVVGAMGGIGSAMKMAKMFM
ncbi:hypothetical protein HYFRA_00010511 [Hymenoscyphus fraxineus]|uniref:Uncharacterized protein n=1 Tax=Hymenoscyphus fraxineus TaxID=746836 RepID=A0A9N9L1B9_9HELO|nr:hypothetical protein HYFRA_00010511 [Hymenoscyphus fraxineus]